MRVINMLRVSIALSLAVPAVTMAQAGGPDTYPVEALKRHQEGTVRMLLTVSTTGSVTDCQIIGTSGSPYLDADACRKALRGVHFTPAHDADGRPIESKYPLKLSYRLPG